MARFSFSGHCVCSRGWTIIVADACSGILCLFNTHRNHLSFILQLCWKEHSYSFWKRAPNLAWSAVWTTPVISITDLWLRANTTIEGFRTVLPIQFNSHVLGLPVVWSSDTVKRCRTMGSPPQIDNKLTMVRKRKFLQWDLVSVTYRLRYRSC